MSSLPPSASPSTRDASETLLKAALLWENDHKDSEHNVARYAILLLRQYFRQDWVMVPQFRTEGKMIPDLVLEVYEERSGKSRSELFVAKVYIEFKLSINRKSAIQQVLRSVSLLPGEKLPSTGVVIAVQGRHWTIMDYHIVRRENKYFLIKSNFYDHGDLSPKRPQPSKTYQGKKAFMDIDVPEEYTDLRKALEYLGTNPESKDLLYLSKGGTHLPVSLTVATMKLVREEDGEDETVDSDSPNEDEEEDGKDETVDSDPLYEDGVGEDYDYTSPGDIEDDDMDMSS